MEKVRFGVIGIGNMGTSHSGWLVGNRIEGAELTAVCDIDEKRREWAKENLPGTVTVYDDYKKLLDSGKIDAVIIAVPHYLHPEIAIEALKRNIHTMVEKPAGVYVSQIRKMNEEAEKHPDVKFAMMFNQRTNPLYQKVKEILDAGTIGNLRRVSWIITSWWRTQKYYDSSAWRATWAGEGGGVLVNQAPHQLDLWQWICGVPNRVYAKCIYGDHRDIIVENDVTIVTEYPNGATGSFVTCTHDPIGTDRLEIDLDGGKIVVEDSRTATVYRLKKNEDELNRTMSMMELVKLTQGNAAGADGGLYTVETFENTDGWGVQHMTVMENFACHMVEGTPLLAPGSDGINGVNLANATLLSSWLGREVDMPVDEDLYLEELNRKIAAEGKFPTR